MLESSSQGKLNKLISHIRGHRYTFLPPQDNPKEALEHSLKHEARGIWFTRHIVTVILLLISTTLIGFFGGITYGTYKANAKGEFGQLICIETHFPCTKPPREY